MASKSTEHLNVMEEEQMQTAVSIRDTDSEQESEDDRSSQLASISSLVFSLDPLSIPSGLHLWLHTDTLSAPSATVLSEAQLSDPFAPEPVSSATSSETSAPSGTSATLAAVTTEVDLFGDAFAASPGETPAAPEGAAAPATPVPVAAALDACSGNDPFAPSEGSAETASELDLFAMKPTETSVPVVTPTTSTASPALATTPSPPPPPFPAAATTATTTTTTTATTSASTTTSTTTAPALDIFGDLFDSVSEVPTAPKSDTAPHVDLLDSDAFSSASHGVSPLAESSLTADLLSDQEIRFKRIKKISTKEDPKQENCGPTAEEKVPNLTCCTQNQKINAAEDLDTGVTLGNPWDHQASRIIPDLPSEWRQRSPTNQEPKSL
ncbi:clathrin coat assembly protein AP180-like [Pleurodeles waltl]|uniref:clathrin coat assembly protein AP180-like n=1 Tax=Pleurodeles waltl TaxID=8319 RepID=UPI0037098F6D